MVKESFWEFSLDGKWRPLLHSERLIGIICVTGFNLVHMPFGLAYDIKVTERAARNIPSQREVFNLPSPLCMFLPNGSGYYRTSKEE